MGEYFSDLHTKKNKKQYCYFIYYLSISRIFSWNWFHGKKFRTSILEYFCTIICEFHHQCRLIYNCCCWCMVCVEKLQTQFNILWYNFFLWWWSSFKNKTKNYWNKVLKNWDTIMMMIWSRDLQTNIHVREIILCVFCSFHVYYLNSGSRVLIY